MRESAPGILSPDGPKQTGLGAFGRLSRRPLSHEVPRSVTVYRTRLANGSLLETWQLMLANKREGQAADAAAEIDWTWFSVGAPN